MSLGTGSPGLCHPIFQLAHRARCLASGRGRVLGGHSIAAEAILVGHGLSCSLDYHLAAVKSG